MAENAKPSISFQEDTAFAVCTSCSLSKLCVPGGLSKADQVQGAPLHYQVNRGDSLYRSDDIFKSIYAVRSGFFKMSMPGVAGRDQVMGFQIPGEVLGLDGLSEGRHSVDAIALEDSEVCVLPYTDLNRLVSNSSSLQHQLHRVMSGEIVREQGVMLLLGSMRAGERVAAFLLSLSDRYKTLGYSPTEFILCMTRDDIGSYLGIKIETVSRCLSNLQNKKLIEAHGKVIRLLDLEGLRSFIPVEINR